MIDKSPEESSKSDNQANQGSDGFVHGDLTRRIIGCAMRVHSTLGNGFRSVNYNRPGNLIFVSFRRSHNKDNKLPGRKY